MSLEEDFAGKDVYSNDGDKLGHVKDVFRDPEMKYAYLVIDCPRAGDRVIPASLVQNSDDRLVLPFAGAFLDDAPDVDVSDRRLGYYDWRALDDYYGRKAA